VRIIDITRPIGPQSRLFPGDPIPSLEVVSDPARGDPARVSVLRVGTHTATHVDAGAHLPGGRGGVESLPLAALVGPARVVAARGSLRAADLAGIPGGGPPRVLFRGEPTLAEEAARLLAERGVVLVGTDGLSIDPLESRDLRAHRVLLTAGVVLLESLDLSAAPPGDYELIALPLLLPGADGAPVRAVLRAP
jgi:arylformamidase